MSYQYGFVNKTLPMLSLPDYGQTNYYSTIIIGHPPSAIRHRPSAIGHHHPPSAIGHPPSATHLS
jgi:hypothetical protein